jgi:H/ACA ribonucleoprotein complex subunit 1
MRPPARGRGGFGGRDGGRGGGGRGFGGRGGGRFGGGGYDQGPPDSVVEAGTFSHPCEGEAVCKLTNDKVGARARGEAARLSPRQQPDQSQRRRQ